MRFSEGALNRPSEQPGEADTEIRSGVVSIIPHHGFINDVDEVAILAADVDIAGVGVGGEAVIVMPSQLGKNYRRSVIL